MKVVPPRYFVETTTDTNSTITVFDRAYSQVQSTVFNTVATISYAFLPAMNKSLHAVLIKICTGGGAPLSLPSLQKHTAHCLTVLHPLLGLHKRSANVSECQQVHFFHIEKFSSTPSLHLHFHVRHRSVRLPLYC